MVYAVTRAVVVLRAVVVQTLMVVGAPRDVTRRPVREASLAVCGVWGGVKRGLAVK